MDKNSFISQLDKIFENSLKEILNEDELETFEKFSNIIKKIEKSTGFSVKIFDKTKDNSEFESTLSIRKKRDFERVKKAKGKSIIVISRNENIILITGDWDYAENYIIPIPKNNDYYLPVYKNNLGGFINIEGEVKIKPKYTDLHDENHIIKLIEDIYFWVKKGNSDYNYGLVCVKGTEYTPFEFFITGKKIFFIESKPYLITQTKKGEIVYSISDKKYIIEPNNYKRIMYNEKNNIFIIKNKNNKFGAYNIKGEEILKPIYDVTNVVDEYIQISENHKIGIYSIKQNKIINTKYNKIVNFKNEIVLEFLEDSQIYRDVFSKELVLLKTEKIYGA